MRTRIDNKATQNARDQAPDGTNQGNIFDRVARHTDTGNIIWYVLKGFGYDTKNDTWKLPKKTLRITARY